MLADVALRPTFPAEELERQRRERLTALAQAHDEARAVAGVLFALPGPIAIAPRTLEDVSVVMHQVSLSLPLR
ncbi:MAG: hypothetical protein ACREMR_01340 [Gemmatimonadales bacterium]